MLKIFIVSLSAIILMVFGYFYYITMQANGSLKERIYECSVELEKYEKMSEQCSEGLEKTVELMEIQQKIINRIKK